MHALRRWGAPVVTAGILVFALSSPFRAAQRDDDRGDAKSSDKRIGDVVRTVINRGADLANRYRDVHGSYLYYEGALVALRPMLEGHADLQKAVDSALAEAQRGANDYQRALALNRALHRIYDKFHPRARTGRDTGATDRGTRDRATRDTGVTDRGRRDRGDRDTGTTDRGTTDRGRRDRGTRDTGTTDRGAKDTGATDRATRDRGDRDTGTSDRARKAVDKATDKGTKDDTKDKDKDKDKDK